MHFFGQKTLSHNHHFARTSVPLSVRSITVIRVILLLLTSMLHVELCTCARIYAFAIYMHVSVSSHPFIYSSVSVRLCVVPSTFPQSIRLTDILYVSTLHVMFVSLSVFMFVSVCMHAHNLCHRRGNVCVDKKAMHIWRTILLGKIMN